MNTKLIKTLGIALVIGGFALASSALADTINYTVSGWGPTQFPGPVTPPATAPWVLTVIRVILWNFKPTQVPSISPLDAYFGRGTTRDGSTNQLVDLVGTGNPMPTTAL